MPRFSDLDDDTRELVLGLLTRAGAMMEDASALAVMAAGQQRPLFNTIRTLEEDSTAIAALIGAARVLAARE